MHEWGGPALAKTMPDRFSDPGSRQIVLHSMKYPIYTWAYSTDGSGTAMPAGHMGTPAFT